MNNLWAWVPLDLLVVVAVLAIRRMTKPCAVVAIAIICSGCSRASDPKAVWTLCRDEVLRQEPAAKLREYDPSYVQKVPEDPPRLPYETNRGYKVSLPAIKESGDKSEEGDWVCRTDGTTTESTEASPAIIIEPRFESDGPPEEVIRRYRQQGPEKRGADSP